MDIRSKKQNDPINIQKGPMRKGNKRMARKTSSTSSKIIRVSLIRLRKPERKEKPKERKKEGKT